VGALLLGSHFARQQALDALHESRRRLPSREARPLQLAESVRHLLVIIRRIVDHDRQQECLRGRNEVGAIDG
jgi:hypothetical protein